MLIQPPAIVQDGKELNDVDHCTGLLGDPKPVFENPRPVGDAMDAGPGQCVVLEDGVKSSVDVQGHRTVIPERSLPCFPPRNPISEKHLQMDTG